ncbi:23S rRNA (uracil(1939)-C(5))-methyltransferase RlmD, partial [Erwinia amylovora]
RLSFHPATQTLHMGFREKSTRELVNIPHCPILKPELNALLQPLHAVLSGFQAVRRLGHVELVQADHGPLLVLRHLDALTTGDRHKLEQFSHKYNVSFYLAADSDSLEQVSVSFTHYRVDVITLKFRP